MAYRGFPKTIALAKREATRALAAVEARAPLVARNHCKAAEALLRRYTQNGGTLTWNPGDSERRAQDFDAYTKARIRLHRARALLQGKQA